MSTDKTPMTFYQRSIVTMSLFCTVSDKIIANLVENRYFYLYLYFAPQLG